MKNKIEDFSEIVSNELDIMPRKEYTSTVISMFISNLSDAYIVVTWPEVQDFMEKDWFEEEAVLDINATFGPSAYFIPIKRLL